jgi:hypothetical protein
MVETGARKLALPVSDLLIRGIRPRSHPELARMPAPPQVAAE